MKWIKKFTKIFLSGLKEKIEWNIACSHLSFFHIYLQFFPFDSHFSIDYTIDKTAGLDPSAYKSSVRKQDTQDASVTALMNDEERFKVYISDGNY